MGCGGGPNAKSLFTFNQLHWKKEIPGAAKLEYNDQRLLTTEPVSELKRAIRWKSDREDWRRLRGSLKKGIRRTKKGLD